MEGDDSFRQISLIYLIGHLIGASIFVPILLVYGLLWGKHSCYGWSVMAMVISFFSWYVSFAVVTGILSPRMESWETSKLFLGIRLLACEWDSVIQPEI